MHQTALPFTDLGTPRQLGRAGEERAFRSAPPEWVEAALAALYVICQTRETFLVDDVWGPLDDYTGPQPDRRAMAAILREGQRLGWCETTGQLRRSDQRQCHGNYRTLRRSLLR